MTRGGNYKIRMRSKMSKAMFDLAMEPVKFLLGKVNNFEVN